MKRPESAAEVNALLDARRRHVTLVPLDAAERQMLGPLGGAARGLPTEAASAKLERIGLNRLERESTEGKQRSLPPPRSHCCCVLRIPHMHMQFLLDLTAAVYCAYSICICSCVHRVATVEGASAAISCGRVTVRACCCLSGVRFGVMASVSDITICSLRGRGL